MEKNLLYYVKKFQNETLSRQEFLKEINHFILKTPTYLNCHDKDVTHEFYAHIVSRIKKIIDKYVIYENASFKTWFTLVLKREFFNFHKKYKKNNELEVIELTELHQNDYIKKNSLIENRNKFLSIPKLTNKEKNVLSLKFGFEINSKNINDSINIIFDKIKAKEKIEQKITMRYHRYVKLDKEINSETDIDKINLLKLKIVKTLKSKRRLEKTFYSLSILPTNKWVGEQLGLSEGTIGAYLTKIKNKFTKIQTEEVA